MLDAIGLGAFLFNFAVVCSFLGFAIVFCIANFALKRGIFLSIFLALFGAVASFIMSPYLFSFYLSFRGYSF